MRLLLSPVSTWPWAIDINTGGPHDLSQSITSWFTVLCSFPSGTARSWSPPCWYRGTLSYHRSFDTFIGRRRSTNIWWQYGFLTVAVTSDEVMERMLWWRRAYSYKGHFDFGSIHNYRLFRYFIQKKKKTNYSTPATIARVSPFTGERLLLHFMDKLLLWCFGWYFHPLGFLFRCCFRFYYFPSLPMFLPFYKATTEHPVSVLPNWQERMFRLFVFTFAGLWPLL